MDISSGSGYPASSLSNFAPHEFCDVCDCIINILAKLGKEEIK